jgi:D-alanyl-D-alanine carboxypeptidase
LDADVEKARDRCLEEDKDGSTVQALLSSSTQIRTSGLGPVIVGPAEPAPIAPPPLKARVPSPKTAAVPAAPFTPGAALTEPMAAVLPKAPTSASPTAIRAPTHVGWIVQIGAFDIERDAQQQLSTAHAKAGPVLDNADPYTEAVMKGDKTLYRARFAGFQQKDEAEAVCKQLKLHDIDCITIKN